VIDLKRRTSSKSRKGVMVAAGGTAGHIMAAVSVAEALMSSGCDSITYLTANTDIDRELLPESQHDVVRYRAHGLSAKRSLRHLLRFIYATAKASVAILIPITKRRPKVVVTFGGFYSLVGSIWAKVLGANVVVVEQNVVLGRANQVVSLFADKVLLAFDTTEVPGRKRDVAQVVGNPIRKEVVELVRAKEGAKAAARAALGVDSSQVLLVITSGSLGAKSINSAVCRVLESFEDLMRNTPRSFPLKVVHFQGKRNGVTNELKIPLVFVEYLEKDFDPNLYLWLAAADLVVSRAGTSTLFELFCLGVPSVFVPLPDAPKNHQWLNANYARELGAAEMVEEGPNLAGRLTEVVWGLLLDQKKRISMAEAAKHRGRTDSADRIAACALVLCTGSASGMEGN